MLVKQKIKFRNHLAAYGSCSVSSDATVSVRQVRLRQVLRVDRSWVFVNASLKGHKVKVY